MKVKTAVILVISVLFLSCGGAADYGEKSYMMPEADKAERSAAQEPSVAMKNSNEAPEQAPEPRERKRILNAYLELTVDDVDAAEKELSRRALEIGGWIVSSNLYYGETSLVVKVPAESFDSYLQSSEKAGDVEAKSITADDVTEVFYDLENRIENKKILQERFRDYLKKAESIEDILSVERQLNDVTTEIEQLEGSFRGLNRDIDYSTVSFNLRLPYSETLSEDYPSFSNAFYALKDAVLTFLYYLTFAVIYLIIFGVPIVLILGLIYLLGWGRVGLIRRFFRKLKK
ncbi:MAG: DUF4349 domain-containing protein [Spirochaetales bacterium]|nr:DUF4349 domain-containing protein [Spirochaetales bacterium]